LWGAELRAPPLRPRTRTQPLKTGDPGLNAIYVVLEVLRIYREDVTPTGPSEGTARAHSSSRKEPVYTLVVDRHGPKFHKSSSTGEISTHYLGRLAWKYERISMKEFVKTMYPPFTSRYVTDETGLSGVYDFTLDLSPYLTNPGTGEPIVDRRGVIDEEPGFLQALPKELGLRLQPKKGEVEVLVIDKVSKDPTEH
ncbi:MAG TPA: TIGR03435 family protein, partial [Bryobacteraceae bacterium]|nr:TIGR03435 family protein [Bryobacteraceae bacterium]